MMNLATALETHHWVKTFAGHVHGAESVDRSRAGVVRALCGIGVAGPEVRVGRSLRGKLFCRYCLESAGVTLPDYLDTYVSGEWLSGMGPQVDIEPAPPAPALFDADEIR